MTIRNALIAAGLAAALAACGGSEEPGTNQAAEAGQTETPPVRDSAEIAQVDADAMAEKLQEASKGTYAIEPSHAFLTFGVSHNGLSTYRGVFRDVDATLTFDPADPAASRLEARVDPKSIETFYRGDYKATHADSGFETWNEDLALNERWFDANAHPEITFTTTSAERMGDYEGTVTGDLTLKGVTRPVTFDVTYNGTGNAPWFGTRDLLGFEAVTTINRSEFDMGALVPMIGDEVEITFSGEFLQEAEG